MSRDESSERPRDPVTRTELHLGISDEDSYLRNELYPSGVARGWRRTGCIAMLVAALVFWILFIILVTLAEG